MKRRSFLLGLLAAPLASLAAKLAPKPAPVFIGVDMALGSDQTSIWLVGTQERFALIQDLPYGAPAPQGQINWLKRSLRGN